MFAWAAAGGPSMEIDPDQERSPPESPTSLEFPRYPRLNSNESQNLPDFKAIYHALRALKSPYDVTVDHLKAFNLKLETDLEGHCIISDQDLQDVPPLVWDSMIDDNDNGQADSHEEPKMFNGVPYPSFEKYEIAKKELLLDNGDAFREAARLPPKPGRKGVRLTQSRKFWMGLERMAQYWDSSLDQYFEVPVSTQVEDKPCDTQQQQHEPVAERDKENSTESGNTPLETNAKKRVYKGRRIGTGSEMPPGVREDTVRGLVEMVAWPFQCQVFVPSQLPKLSIQGLLFPVRHSFISGRVPQDRQTARSGVLEGPLLGVQCRDEIKFSCPGEGPHDDSLNSCDLLRELGAMLLLAQERAREGTVEVRPGEGKWWASAPRFGGDDNVGVTGEGASTEDNTEKEAPQKDTEAEMSQVMHKRLRYAHPLSSSRRSIVRTRKLTAGEKWKIVGPGPSLWDRKMKYMQIGKVSNSPFDDIFMVSHINHHVSILHLRVHRQYIESLTTGVNNATTIHSSCEQPWNELRLRRTKWYDLFNAEQRLEVFHSLWRLYHYMMR